MKLNISENIKRLRREQSMTQERLAELMGVSSTAVSKWESASTYPDITALIPLSEIFGVSTDELLGIKKGERAARLDEVKTALKHVQYNDSLPESAYLDAARQAVAEFPADEYLQHELAWALRCVVYFSHDLDDAEKKKMTDESEKILLRLMNSALDEEMRINATNSLVALYAGCVKDTKRALEVADRLPELLYCREIVKADCLCDGGGDSETEIRCLQEAIVTLTDHLCTYIAMLSRNADNNADTIEMRKTSNLICNIISGGDLKWEDLVDTVASNNLAIARAHAAMGNTADAIDAIEEMCLCVEAAAEKFGTEHGTKFKSIYLSSLTYEPDEDETCERLLLQDQIGCRMEGLKNKCFDSIRDDERFVACVERLKEIGER